jgi:YesN/AraC family two-component response regulator
LNPSQESRISKIFQTGLSAEYFKGAITQEQLQQSLQAVRTLLGATISRGLTTKTYATTLPGAPTLMNKAMDFLSNKQYKVYEVAKLVGYEDEKCFSKLFKKNQGVTPDEFRKKHRAD